MAAQGGAHPVRDVLIGGFVLLVIIGAVANGCSSNGSSGHGHNAPSGYDGWTTSIQKTTCVQWDDDMSPAQRFAMSQDMIVRLGAKDTSDAFAASFVRDVSKVCGARVDSVGDVAAGIATIATADFNS